MTSSTRLTTALSMLLGFATAASFIACAGAERDPSNESRDAPDDVLLTSSGALELHLRGGRVLEIEPATETREDARVRQIRSLDELRASWEQVAAEPLPSTTAGGTIQVNGWVGLECVRRGKACGRPPDDAPRAMVVIRFD